MMIMINAISGLPWILKGDNFFKTFFKGCMSLSMSLRLFLFLFLILVEQFGGLKELHINGLYLSHSLFQRHAVDLVAFHTGHPVKLAIVH